MSGNPQPVRALVVEDEFLLLALLEELLPDLGVEVTARARSAEGAVAAARTPEHFDIALVDVNLAGEQSYDAVDALLEARVPTLFITGYGSGSLPPRFATLPVLSKPFGRDDLARALAALCGGSHGAA
ncbi:response regulator [Pseudoxanthomonas sp. SGNA-20]|jgi:FOG: CheY-like receiver|uniref:response regulator n=1 Tax=unclassified Pseudoxanthomonas TaxID=2645906 RepID=UPI0002E5B201|nr:MULTISPECIES: response regulator [unclassified Pseudoxanthomonas]RRN55513.1 response regulator [Pseudoxanthomonas sp. SGNA-20]RRN79521.1 response regulator [Pseudoxanthomonas sp. SGD-10]